MADKAIKYQEMGFPVIKVKLGSSTVKGDVDRIHAIRDAIGMELH